MNKTMRFFRKGGWLLIPGFIGFLIFYVIPFIFSFYYSIIKGPMDHTIIYLENFINTINSKYTWNMVEPVLILTKNPELRTLGTAFNDIYAYNSSIAFSGSVIYMLPVVFLYLMFEREIRDIFSVIRLHGH